MSNDAAERVRRLRDAIRDVELCIHPATDGWHKRQDRMTELREAIAVAMEAEHEEGRRAGLEEAARVLDDEAALADPPRGGMSALTVDVNPPFGKRLRRMAREVRALATPTPDDDVSPI